MRTLPALLPVLMISALAAPSAPAEISRAKVVIDGVGCPFCVYGLEKKLEAVEGIRDIRFDLKSGVATLVPAEETVPAAEDVEAAVRNAGFTPREIELTAIGTVVSEREKLFLAVRGSKQKLLLFDEDAPRGNLLRDATQRTLASLEERETTVAVTGSAHSHEDRSPSLVTGEIEAVHSVSLAVEGMKCTKCAGRLERILERMDGVYRVAVHFETKRAQVESIGKRLDPTELRSAIRDAGFSASVVEPEAGR